ncbi:hypothetical protein [Trichloromonas sp.]|uniref:hypothetical protein n=1 Tax=Trichloromonas sp. TaxID=3069249 RepID=UPI001D8ABCF6|nr:hypothetical protein [Desulfuromonadaceae bacterium]MDY0269074.1 hypothetical protein [Trichloromonas sp.]
MTFNIETLALPQDFQNMSGAKKLWTTIPVRKPGKTEFFRVLDDDAYTLRTAIIELKEESETYLVDGALLSDLSEFIVPVQVVVALTRMGSLMVWPLKLPQERHNAWHATALQAAELAKKKWICMRANMSAGCYDILEATAALPEPEFPTAELSFERMLELAFANYYVNSLNHPLIRRLTGQV